MKRRGLLLGVGVTLAGATIAAPLTASGQHRAMPVIGWAGFANDLGRDPLIQGLRDLGYVEGRSITIVYAFPREGEIGFASPIAELIRRKVDLIATAGFPATAAAHKAATTIPVVFVVADPVGAGFAASLARPGGSMTGLSLAVEEQFSGKWLELLKEAMPSLSQVAYLWNPANHGSASSWKAMQELAPKLGVMLQSAGLPDLKALDKALVAIEKGRAEALILDSDTVTRQLQAPIVAFARAHRLPLISALRRTVDAGGLMSYGPDLRALWRQAAVYVDKILKGAKPADLPVEQPTSFELVINLRAAKAIGLTLPQSLLQRADEVIE